MYIRQRAAPFSAGSPASRARDLIETSDPGGDTRERLPDEQCLPSSRSRSNFRRLTVSDIRLV